MPDNGREDQMERRGLIGRRCRIAGGCILLWHGDRIARCGRCRAWWIDGEAVEDAVVGDQLRAVEEAMAIMRDARGHYGIEKTGGPGQPATEWDEIADRMQAFVRRYGRRCARDYAR